MVRRRRPNSRGSPPAGPEERPAKKVKPSAKASDISANGSSPRASAPVVPSVRSQADPSQISIDFTGDDETDPGDASRSSATRQAEAEPYDVCFGLLCIPATITRPGVLRSECTPAILSFDNDLLKVYLEGLDAAAAIAMSPSLYRLTCEFSVTLTATICTKPQKVFRDSNPLQGLAISQHVGFETDCSLRIIVYGFMEQRDSIAQLLGNGDLFLQHPGRTEFDRKVKYRNPQYLLPPGEDMPDIEKLSVYTCCAESDGTNSARRDALGEGERDQIYSIFNTIFESTGVVPMTDPSPRLATQLKRHQAEALTMMVEKEAGNYEAAHFPSLWTPIEVPDGEVRYQNVITKLFSSKRPPPISGGILADEMGLGKTLSALALICYSLDHFDNEPSLSERNPRSSLIVVPKSTIYGWEKQIEMHIHPERIQYVTYQGSTRRQLKDNLRLADIVLTTFDTLRADVIAKETCLYEMVWARVILDEAHRIRNRSSALFSSVVKLEASSRWCLTGTPIQNRLDDFGSLLSFLRIPHLGTKLDFQRYIEDPMKKKPKEGLESLRKVVAATCLRRTKANYAATLQLPQKTERRELIEMDPEDRILYNFFKSAAYHAAREKYLRSTSAHGILVLISVLRLVCNHGEALLPKSASTAWNSRDKTSLTWEIFEAGCKQCAVCGREEEDLVSGESIAKEFGCGHILCDGCTTESPALNFSGSPTHCSLCGEKNSASSGGFNDTQLSSRVARRSRSRKQQWPVSKKILALLGNLMNDQQKRGPKGFVRKSVVFSFWTKMLDLIEAALKARGISYCRIDGQSTMQQRRQALDTFTRDARTNVMLASISAAGEGIDLTAASTVHIVEPHWNPMAEAQAIDRVHRIGQQQDVEVIRYIVDDSIELYIQWVQMDKLRLITKALSASNEDVKAVDNARFEKLMKYLE